MHGRFVHLLKVKVKVKVNSCLTLCYPMNYTYHVPLSLLRPEFNCKLNFIWISKVCMWYQTEQGIYYSLILIILGKKYIIMLRNALLKLNISGESCPS